MKPIHAAAASIVHPATQCTLLFPLSSAPHPHSPVSTPAAPRLCWSRLGTTQVQDCNKLPAACSELFPRLLRCSRADSRPDDERRQGKEGASDRAQQRGRERGEDQEIKRSRDQRGADRGARG
eukprot:2021661-Rhodomonas_salina.2